MTTSPLNVQVTDLPSDGLSLTGEIPFAALDLHEDERTHLATPMRYALKAFQMGGDLLVNGRLSARVECLCDRCAEWFSATLETTDVCHQYENVIGQVVNLTDAVREDILMAFPQVYICSETCRGLCPKCGCNLNHESCDCELDEDTDDEMDGASEDSAENPWAALDGLELKSENDE